MLAVVALISNVYLGYGLVKQVFDGDIVDLVSSISPESVMKKTLKQYMLVGITCMYSLVHCQALNKTQAIHRHRPSLSFDSRSWATSGANHHLHGQTPDESMTDECSR